VYDGTKSTTYQFLNEYGIGKAQALQNYGLPYEEVRSSFEIVTLDYPQGLEVSPLGTSSLGKNIIWEFNSFNYTLQGLVGLHQPPVNFSDFGGQAFNHPSFIQTLRDSNQIPSVSYGYTAGALYGTYSLYFL
jgi:hypothetical protein